MPGKYTRSILCAVLAAAPCLISPIAFAQTAPPGEPKTAKSKALETGANLLQSNAPTQALNVYLNGVHVAKNDTSHQMEAHHFCHQKNQDFMQCALFDGNTAQANLVGIEYIISEKTFSILPPEEKKYWHPHNYEILSGQLTVPGIPKAAEHELMKEKINSYGKTWHVWNSAPFGKIGDRLPVGEPVLEWSFNRDGEMQIGLVEGRDQRLGTDTAENRRNRADLLPLANPQSGVDVLKRKFPHATVPIPGVDDQAVVGRKR